jgi:hypothetical protein
VRSGSGIGILMIVFFLFVLLLVFVAGFFGLDGIAQNVMQASDVKILGFSLLTDGFRVFLGIGILILQFAIIIFSMLDRIGDTIREIIKATVRIVPFVLFLSSTWKTFSPILATLLPPSVNNTLGMASTNASVAQIVNSDSFSLGVILTLVTMFLFIVTTYALSGPRESPQVKALKAELARARKELRRGL